MFELFPNRGGGGLGEVKAAGAQRIIVEYLELTDDGYGVLAQPLSCTSTRTANHFSQTSSIFLPVAVALVVTAFMGVL